MSRLPDPGGDDGSWGDILNDFLFVAHTSDGTLKPLDSIPSDIVETTNIQDGAVTEAKLSFTPATQSSIDDHVSDATAAHAASAISYAGSADLASSNVESALDELDSEKAASVHTHSAGSITGLSTAVGDELEDYLVEGTNINFLYEDGTLTISANANDTNQPQDSEVYTTNHTLILADAYKRIEMDSASDLIVTLPHNNDVAFPIGVSIDILRINTGRVSVLADSGVGVNATPGLNLRDQWSSVTAIKRATNQWVIVGDLSV